MRLKATIPAMIKTVMKRLVFFPESQTRNQKKRNWTTLSFVLGVNSRAGIIMSPAIHNALALKIFSYASRRFI
jgi:hypothetical protein